MPHINREHVKYRRKGQFKEYTLRLFPADVFDSLNLTIMKKKSDFEADYDMVQKIDDRKLENIAIKKAQSYIIDHKAIDYKDLYLTAGFFFRT
jgi:hypothetical protein